MFKSPLLLISLAMIGFSSATLAANPSEIKFARGQEWSIKSTPSTKAKVVVGRVETRSGTMIVHVSIIDIPIPQGVPGAGGVTRIGHVAFEVSALSSSVDRLIATGVLPASSFETGYKQWESEGSEPSMMSVPDVISLGLSAMNQSPE